MPFLRNIRISPRWLTQVTQRPPCRFVSSSGVARSSNSPIVFYLNQERIRLPASSIGRQSLLDWLRVERGLTGTKKVCNEGGCGACTVMVSRWDANVNKPSHHSVCACLMPLPSLDGMSVTTIEGISRSNVAATEESTVAPTADPKCEYLHPVQKALMSSHATQCGYCTPGVAMSLYSRLAQDPKATMADLEHCLDGNICRCTGYRPIMDAGKLLSSDCVPTTSAQQLLRVQVQKSLESTPSADQLFPFRLRQALRRVEVHGDDFSWYRPNTLHELLKLRATESATLAAGSHSHHWEGASAPNITKMVSGFTDVGVRLHSDVHESQATSVVLSTAGVPELSRVEWRDDGVLIGASVTINGLASLAAQSLERLKPHQTRFLETLGRHVHFFANGQVRDMGTLAGSLVNCSHVSDLVPAMTAFDAKVHLARLSGDGETIVERTVSMDEFIVADCKVALAPDEVLTRVFVPYTSEREFAYSFKQGHKRRFDAIAVLNGSFRVLIGEDAQATVRRASLVFGGLGRPGLHARHTEEYLVNRPWSDETRTGALASLRSELTTLVHESRHPSQRVRDYQATLMLSQWSHMMERITTGLRTQTNATFDDAGCADTAPLDPVHRAQSDYAFDPTGTLSPIDEQAAQQSTNMINRALVHVNAIDQTTGGARYTADLGVPPGGLYGALVTSTQAHARILRVDPAPALAAVDDAVAFYSAKDVPGDNMVPGFRPNDFMPVFAAHNETLYHGQPIGIVVARTAEAAKIAASAVHIEYEPLHIVGSLTDAAREAAAAPPDTPPSKWFFATKPVFGYQSLREGRDDGATTVVDLEENQRVPVSETPDRTIKRGDTRKILSDIEAEVAQSRAGNKPVCAGVTNGRVDLTHGQYHFYLETQNCLVTPEGGRTSMQSGSGGIPDSFIVQASTQAPSQVCDAVSCALGVPQSAVSTSVERIGGGFGGKQTMSGNIAAAAAVAAFHQNAPVKLVLSRDQDMAYCPGRVPFVADYRMGWRLQDDASVRLEAFECDILLGGGYAQDYAVDILETAMFVLDSGYQLPRDVTVNGRCARTNRGVYTATRGFGKPESSAIIECVLDHVATEASVDPVALRSAVMYDTGAATLAGMVVGDGVLRACWNAVVNGKEESSDDAQVDEYGLPRGYATYETLRRYCDAWNARPENRMVKRGVAAVVSKGNSGFVDSPDVNRGLVMVHVQKDGSVFISHSGVEMGQGLSTRVRQVAATALRIPIELIRVAATNTLIVPNSPPTTMVSTDLVGGALEHAVARLHSRLAPLRQTSTSQDDADLTASEWCCLVHKAYNHGIEMTAPGIVNLPTLAYDFEKQSGDISYFFVWGAAMSVVEMDVRTGAVRTLRTDIVQDCGQHSLNPALDVGQVEGGFMFGYGYYMLEEMEWDQRDNNYALFSNNVGRYKVPMHDDAPLDWRVRLLRYRDGLSKAGVYGTKGIGEANVQLALSAHLAARQAVLAARRDNGHATDGKNHVVLPFPATPDRVRMLIDDPLTAHI